MARINLFKYFLIFSVGKAGLKLLNSAFEGLLCLLQCLLVALLIFELALHLEFTLVKLVLQLRLQQLVLLGQQDKSLLHTGLLGILLSVMRIVLLQQLDLLGGARILSFKLLDLILLEAIFLFELLELLCEVF